MALVLLALLGANGGLRAQPMVVTLEQAMTLAESSHPSLRAALADSTAARAAYQESKALLWNNPQLGVEARQRRLSQTGASSATGRDLALGISQTFETGGQPAARRDAAQASLSATDAAIEATVQSVRAAAAQRFYQVLALQELVQIEQAALDVLRRASSTMQKRVKAGEDSRLDGNLAAVEAERSANQLAQSRERLLQASAELATALQLSAGASPQAAGELSATSPPYTEQDLLLNAARQPALQAARIRAQAAEGRLALERAARYPDVTVGVFQGNERGIDTRDRVTTVSISLPLPVFRNNGAAIGRAASELERSRIERDQQARSVESTVRLLWQRLASLQDRVARLRREVLARLEQNRRLSLKALQAGEIGLTQYLLVRRQTLDAQRDVLNARLDLQITRSELEAAAGWPQSILPTRTRP